MPNWSITRGSAITLGALIVICVLGLQRNLWTPDEPREAEISREMLLSPSVVPTLNGRAFMEKPPLYYWAVAGVFALTEQVTPAAARSVSALSSFFTLLLVFLWGRREFSVAVGSVAALGLATSCQFLISTHWVLIDPLLMLFTTIAVWAAWELVHGSGGKKATACFYGALTLALWTKGLIGPVLVGCGLAVFCAVTYRSAPWRRLRLGTGFTVLILATAVLAWAIYASAGSAAVREWFWVNHVQRFVDPQNTGHDQPVYYYLLTLPVALLPWWVAFADVFRLRPWRGPSPGSAVKRYWRLMALGMALILTASATKRGIYLLPLLPPLFLLLAANAVEWWYRASSSPTRSLRWWLQVAMVVGFTSVPTIVGLIYTGTSDARAVAFLIGVAAIVIALVAFAVRGQERRALGAFAACAVAGVVGLIEVVPHLADSQKSMAPFLTWVDERLPGTQPVYALGQIDETLEGIVPFTTGRMLVALTSDETRVQRPEYLLVQDKSGGTTAPSLPRGYRLLRERSFGPGRYLALWQDSAAKPLQSSAEPAPAAAFF